MSLKSIAVFLIALLITTATYAQKKKNTDPAEPLKSQALTNIQSEYDTYKKIALQIWDYAELGYKEVKSTSLLQETLRNNGFQVTNGVAGIPTAFVATYGSGLPVIGILAEYDALPGLSQKAQPERSGIDGQAGGHGCGHNLFGTASVAAGIELKKMIEQKKISGTIKIFGCPAEEGGSGKVYMVREGLFSDVDVALHWHPAAENATQMVSALANSSAKFRFKGISSHAAAAPEKGRSALDAVEAMDHMVNMMREHVPQETRIHYVITNGGKAPNVIPDFAEVYYYVRHPKRDQVKQIFERVVNAARGAALGTETEMSYEVIGGTHDLLLNKSLAEIVQRNLQRTGGVKYSNEELQFAQRLQTTYGYAAPDLRIADSILPLKQTPETGASMGSTDVGDVSYVVPTVGFTTATFVPGTPMHSWQAVACGGTDIGVKGLMVAAKTIALTAIDLFTHPEYIQKAKEEFKQQLGNYKYEALLGDRKPALNYRD